ncbi:MAG: glycosyltransferase [Phycisphaerales bacterium]|nr:glycosyltransferase [Phycisphaerales bacterium]
MIGHSRTKAALIGCVTLRDPIVVGVDVSVLIPTFQRPDKLRRCLASLSVQRTHARFEVIVGVDGGQGASDAIDLPPPLRDRTRIEVFAKIGYIAVRHRLLQVARGRLFLSLNDDVEAAPDFIERHIDSHRSGPRVVSGRSEWRMIDDPTLFDQLVQRTNLIFFAPPQDRAPTYRDCYGLNMSAPVALAQEVGGFHDIQDAYGYDDIELAHRLITQGGATMTIAPEAAVTHDHRYTPLDVLRREYLLGRSAWVYAAVNPGFARDLFGRDIRSPAELDHAAAFLDRERRDAVRIQARFLDLATQPALAETPSTPKILAALSESWILLKRFLWRQGLLAAARGEANDWAPLKV